MLRIHLKMSSAITSCQKFLFTGCEQWKLQVVNKNYKSQTRITSRGTKKLAVGSAIMVDFAVGVEMMVPVLAETIKGGALLFFSIGNCSSSFDINSIRKIPVKNESCSSTNRFVSNSSCLFLLFVVFSISR